MRTLHADLTAAQKKPFIRGLYKIVLTKSGEDTQTFEQDRIVRLVYDEEEDRQSTEVLLNNSDGALTGLDLKGYKGVISCGMTDANGVDRYSAKAPLWVIAQQFRSLPGQLICSLSLAGAMNLMQSDRATHSYYPDADDTNTVKDFINALLDTTMTGFNWPSVGSIPVYSVVFDSEDDVIDDYMPKDSFKVELNTTRLSALKTLLAYTSCRARVENDGSDNAEIHIFVPTTTGTSYDYEYSLASGEHTFFAKALRDRIVIPNYVRVQWPAGDSPEFSAAGAAPDSSLMLKFDSHVLRVKSNAEALRIVVAKTARNANDAQKGQGIVPINVGQEVWDYILITDTRENQNATGNVAWMRTTCGDGKMTLEVRFGRVTLFGLSGTSLPQFTGQDITKDDLYNLIKALWEILENLLAWAESVDISAIQQTVMTTLGDILYRDETEAERLGGDYGKGYNFLKSWGSDGAPEWVDIEDIIQELAGAVNRMVAASLVIPVPTILLATAEDHSGGGETSDKSLSVMIPTIAHAQAAAAPAAIGGAIADDDGAQTDETTEANENTADDMTLLPAVPEVNDAYYFGKTTVWDWLSLEISTAGDGVWTIVWEYYDGDSWELLTGISDTSEGFTVGGTHSVSFHRPSDWATSTIILENVYWIRARVSAYTSIVTQPLGQQAWLGTH